MGQTGIYFGKDEDNHKGTDKGGGIGIKLRRVVNLGKILMGPGLGGGNYERSRRNILMVYKGRPMVKDIMSCGEILGQQETQAPTQPPPTFHNTY